MNRFDLDALETVGVPDLWPDVLRRSAGPGAGTVEPSGVVRHRPWPMLAAAACALVVAAVGAVAVVANRDDGGAGVSTEGSTVPSSGGPASSPPAASTPIVCADGGLDPGSVPESATPEPLPADEQTRPGQQAIAWTDGEIRVELLAPAHMYIDFVGERTEPVGETGVLWFRDDDTTHLLDATGFAASCSRYELTARGGTEDERRDLLLSVAGGLEWEASRGVSDCGPLSAETIQRAEGPTVAAVLTDLELAGISLETGLADPVTRWSVGPDGRCRIDVMLPDGLPVRITVSGQDGTYGIDQVAGFSAPFGVAATAEDIENSEDGEPWVEPAASYTSRLDGRAFQVDLDYWCVDCAEAELAVVVPGDDITATTTVTQQATFTGELPSTPTPGASRIEVVLYRTADGVVRGVLACIEPSP